MPDEWHGQDSEREEMESTTDGSAPPQSPAELIDRIERSWQAWVNAVDGIPDDRLAEPIVGHWSTKDLLGHVAFWEAWVIGDCQRIVAGEPETGEEMDPINQGQVAENTDATVAAQKRYRQDAHANLIAYLGSIDANEPTFSLLVEALAGETWGHYREHTAEVLKWRAAEGI